MICYQTVFPVKYCRTLCVFIKIDINSTVFDAGVVPRFVHKVSLKSLGLTFAMLRSREKLKFRKAA